MKGTFIFRGYLFALFPGFFVFHVLHSLGLMPYVGWFSTAILAGTAIIIGTFTLYAALGKAFNYYLVASCSVVWLFLIYCILIILYNHLIIREDYFSREGLYWNITNLFLMLGFFTIGLNLHDVKLGAMNFLLFAFYIFYAISTYYLYMPANSTIVLPVLPGIDPETIASYQSLAMCVLYTALVICIFARSKIQKTMYFFSSLVILYFIGSRTEFFLLLLVSPLFININFGEKVTAAFAALAMIVIPGALLTIDFNQRFSAIFSELGSGSSRFELMERGMLGIYRSPIIGDYLGQARDGEVGSYIHNILSVYQQFGLIGFSWYLLLILMSLVIGFVLRKGAKADPLIEILIYTSIMSFVGVLVSKSVAWPLPALAWGVACSCIAKYHKPKITPGISER